MPHQYLISIATYKRPEGLARLLDSLEVALSGRTNFNIVVVDNDPQGTGEEAAKQSPLRVTYVIEEEPGIASARNRGLTFFTADHRGIIFVDDDEWVEPDWFENLTRHSENSDAGVVQGPVITLLPSDAPEWITQGGFYQRKSRKTGEQLESAATNNTLLTRDAWLSAGSPVFDTAFSSTGGSDWDLFWGIRKSGVRIEYCEDAIVSEDVPPSRMGKKWLRQRYIRNGIVGIRVCKKHGDLVLPYIFRALAVGAVGLAQIALSTLRGQGPQAVPMSRALVSWGKISGLFGQRIHEYKRQN